MSSVTETAQPPGYLRHAIVLGLITAVGPFAIDMYLPSLPSIGASLHASGDAVQYTLMGFFISLGFGQLLFGPLSDMLGRKIPIYLGLGLYAVGSVGCALARNVETLIVFRVIQGLGASGGMAICQAVVRDLHTGPAAARLMSLLMLVFSTSPILAPLVGSFLIQFADWRAVFWTVTALSLLGILLTAFSLDETRPRSLRQSSGLMSALQGYARLLRDAHFLGLAFIGAFGISSFFVFLSGSSFVYIGHFGLSPRLYSFGFSINAVAFIGAAQFNGWLTGRYGLRRVVWVAVLGFTLSMLALLAAVLAGFDGLAVLVPLMFLSFGFLGLVLPTTSVLALEHHGAIAGTASSLMGMLQLITGAVVMALAGLIADGTPRPMVIGMAASAVVTLLFAYLSVQRRRPAAEAVPAE